MASESTLYRVVVIDGDGRWYYDGYTPWNGDPKRASYMPREEALRVAGLALELPGALAANIVRVAA